MLKKVVVYSHDTFGLGNIRRMLTISQSLLANMDDLSILLITGSPMIHSFSSTCHNLDYLKLPCLSRDLEGDYRARNIGFETKRLVKMRAEMIKSAVKAFNPDLMLVDKKPLGIQNELLRTLDFLHHKKHCKIVLLLRDILDSPEKTVEIWNKHQYQELIGHYYDRVLVAGSRETFDVCKEYRFSDTVADLVRFCGYIHRNEHPLPQAVPSADGEKTILVTPGGGEDGFKLMENYALGLDWLSEACLSVLVTGPEMPQRHTQTLKNLLADRPNVVVRDFVDNMTDLMRNAHLVISMAGYNTVCEILSLKKRAVVVPRVLPVQEQWIRASRFAQQGLLDAIHPDDITPKSLIDAVNAQLGNPLEPDLSAFDFNGLGAINQEIRSLLPATPCPKGYRPLWQQQAVQRDKQVAPELDRKAMRLAAGLAG